MLVKTRIAELSSGEPWVRKFEIQASEKFWWSRDRPHHRVINVKKTCFDLCAACNLCLTW